MLSRKAAKKLTQRVLGLAAGKELSVQVAESQDGNTRFARGEPTTTGDVERTTISVTATVQGRRATVSGNRVDSDSLARLVRDAEEMAALSPVDPESMAPLGPQKYLEVNRHDRDTARLGPGERLAMIRRPIQTAAQRGLETAGLVRHGDSVSVVANKAGLFGYERSTFASLSATCRTTDGSGSGRAASVSHRVGGIDLQGVASTAADKAELSQMPRALDPGRYTVILESQAVADLLGFLTRSFSARSADEGRSFFSKKGGGTRLGESLFDARINLRSDPADAEHPAAVMDGGGFPQRAVTWIDGGKLANLQYSRFWADKQGAQSLPRPTSMRMDGSSSSLQDLISGVDRGVLVTRFWYNRMLEPRTILATGLTRDGTYLVEDGKITTAVKNFRYNESPVTMLRNVLALGEPARTESRGQVVVVPPMVVSGFRFVATSDAV
jgi:predicted Zn-dependent protease